MLTQQERSRLPIVETFPSGKFDVKMKLDADPEGDQLLVIELTVKDNQGETYICSVDTEKLRTNAQLSRFDSPASLFQEMLNVKNQISITEYGEIQFTISLGKTSKFPITLSTGRKGLKFKDICTTEKNLLKIMELNAALHQKVAENGPQILSLVGQYNKLKSVATIQQKKMNRVILQATKGQEWQRKCLNLSDAIRASNSKLFG